jgi:hypothetical protein
VPIFDDVIPDEDLWPVHAERPIFRANALILRYRAKFPSINYDLFWETRLMNAQAFIGSSGRCVRLYGGLGRHRRIGVEGLAFALAHETGHHLGGAPYHPCYTCLSSEDRANEWAIEIGLPIVFGEKVGERFAYRGQMQIETLSSQYSLPAAIW